LTVGWADVVIEDNAPGDLSLARAFESREPDTGEPSRGTKVSIDDIHLGHVWVHGHTAAVPLIDADVDDLDGALSSTKKALDIDVKRVNLRGRGLAGKDPEGILTGSASLPSDSQDGRRVSARYEGRVGAIVVSADG